MNNEKELEKSIENNEWKSVTNFSEMKSQFKAAAKNTLLKDQRMNIRIAQRDLEGLKTKALEEGMPYQTLVSSVLHKYVTGKLIEKKA
jgi:predicted DNA binding CopG/RHH family protein